MLGFGKFWAFTGSLVLSVALIGMPRDAFACRLALVLAIDVSRSVNSADYALQFRGLADAFRDEQVRAAILGGGATVAASAFEWSGEGYQSLVADWSLLMTADDLDKFASRLENHSRTHLGKKTAIGSALAFGHGLLSKGPDCSRFAIDFSGDGYNNDGPAPQQVKETLNFTGITVNALVIGGLRRRELTRYFETNVIQGPGAFAIPTQGFSDFAEAIRRKLLRELKDRDVIAEAK